MPISAKIINGKKTFTVLENHPEVFNTLAHKLGLSTDLEFHDIYSLTDPDLLSLIPRPVLALLVIIPMTPAWHADRTAEDANKPSYAGSGPEEPVMWFQQTIGEACGSIGLLHCLLNGPAREFILPETTLSRIREQAVPLKMAERAQLLYDSKALEDAHQSVAEMGDTAPPSTEERHKECGHFVAFVKEKGKLWELEGNRKGPIERGELGEEEDVLSEGAVERGIGRVIKLEKERENGDLRFSVIALTKRE